MADIRISSLPQVANQRAPVLDQAVAQRQNYGFQAAATNSNVSGLVSGLAQLNPALNQYTDQAVHTEATAARRAGIAEANRMEMSGIAEKDLLGSPLPSSVPPAYDLAYREGFKGILSERAGATVKADMIQAYDIAKDKPGFDPGTFFSSQRGKLMGGFVDPVMAAKVGANINSAEVAIRSDIEQKRMKLQSEALDSSLAQVVQDKLSPTMSIEELAMSFNNEVLPAFRNVNKSPKDAQEFMLSHLAALSEKLGGAPQLFDIFEMPGADGKTMSSFNSPETATRIRAMQEHATSQLNKKMLEAGQEVRFDTIVSLDKQRDADPSSITPELIKSHMGKFGVFTTEEAAHSYYAQAQKLVQSKLVIGQMQRHYDEGSLYSRPPKEQTDLLEANLGPQIDLLVAAATQGKPEEVATLASKIIQEAARRRASVAIPALERFVEVMATTGQNKDGPDASFLSRVELYKAFSAAPQMRKLYFKGDAADLMETYVSQADSDPKAAYNNAFASVTPEAKAAAEVRSKTPEAMKYAKAAVDKVVGSSMIPQLIGGSGRPGNTDAVDADTRAQQVAYLRSHPSATESMLKSFTSDYVSQNWVHDETSNAAIKVPRAYANEQTQAALTDLSARIGKDQRLDDRPGDWRVEYRAEGSEGEMSIMLTNGAGSSTLIGRKNLKEINEAFYNQTHIDHKPTSDGSMNEGQKIAELQRQVLSGKVDPKFIAENQGLLAKVRTTNALPSSSVNALDKMQADEIMKQLKDVPKMSFGEPDYSTLSKIKQRGTAMVDTSATALMAKQFATVAVGRNFVEEKTTGLALSLIVMGEGVVKQVYNDPASGAGMNIGAGYNLKANAANAQEDLKRAGVPVGSIAGVMDGRFQMTTEQVQRLTQISLSRYASMTKDTAEKTSPGLWNKMTPGQKAVMIDVAYQVGSTDQFKKAWSALASGDAKGFAENANTTYVNQAGVRVSDTRRNSLRAAMLQGSSSWDATINKYGSLPSNALEVAAINRK